MEAKNTKKILLTGGSTGGSVTPLLSLKNGLNDYELLWIGTRDGIEKKMIEKEKIKFKAIFSGKLRRYFSLKNFLDPLLVFIGFIQSIYIILKFKPNLVMSAGGFVSVPCVWAAWLCRVPILIHQQDARPGLANKLMAPFAKIVTVTFKNSLKDYGEKALWIGNPVREFKTLNFKLEINDIYKHFKFNKELPIIFVMGGIGGALSINEIISKSLPELTKFCQIIHITGKNIKNLNTISGYHATKFMNIDILNKAYAVSDIIISRCGMGTLTEISSLAKPAILIPMPDGHQEDNAQIFKKNNAAIIIKQQKLTEKLLIDNIKKLLKQKKLRFELSKNISKIIKKNASKKMIMIIKTII